MSEPESTTGKEHKYSRLIYSRFAVGFCIKSVLDMDLYHMQPFYWFKQHLQYTQKREKNIGASAVLWL